MSRFARMRHIVEYAAFRATAALIAALPLEAASRWSGLGWRAIAPHLRRHRRALDNLAAAFPEMSAAKRERIALDMWENLGRTFAEFFHLGQIAAQGRLVLEPPERFRAVAAAGPFVVCGLHMGNWELMALAGHRFGIKLAGVYQILSNPLVDRAVYALRAPWYLGGLRVKSTATARALLRQAHEGGSPAFLADLREGRGVVTPFFGQPALSNPFPALIARATGLPLYAARVMRLANAHFSMRIERIEVPKTDDRDADVAAATAALHARFEEFIREAPEQWTWAHRRWH
ncbi:MAG: lauroyl acyltransferase [Roseiarcus sp.]|jgi:KDO2-lipid IV(A) lauroyltransferase